jgi:hypothetical protein
MSRAVLLRFTITSEPNNTFSAWIISALLPNNTYTSEMNQE